MTTKRSERRKPSIRSAKSYHTEREIKRVVRLLTSKQTLYGKTGLFGDWDRDGMMNVFDSNPFKKHNGVGSPILRLYGKKVMEKASKEGSAKRRRRRRKIKQKLIKHKVIGEEYFS